MRKKTRINPVLAEFNENPLLAANTDTSIRERIEARAQLRQEKLLEDEFIEHAIINDSSNDQLESRELARKSQESPAMFLEAQRLITEKHTKLSHTLKARELGLSLGVIGTAEMQVHRLASINRSLFSIEDRLMWLAENGNMSSDAIMDFYKILVANQERAGRFIVDVGKSVNWDNIRQEMVELEAASEANDSESDKAAEIDGMVMLRKLADLEQGTPK